MLQGSLRSLSGVDDTVSPRTLCDISQEFAFVEPLEAEIWLVSGIELIELSSMISMKCNHQICGFNMIQHDSTWFNHQDWELNQEILYIWYSIGLIGVVERILTWNTCLNSQIASFSRLSSPTRDDTSQQFDTRMLRWIEVCIYLSIYMPWSCLELFTGICTSSQNPILDRW